MFRKHDIRFPAESGIELSAWLFVPQQRSGRLPISDREDACL